MMCSDLTQLSLKNCVRWDDLPALAQALGATPRLRAVTIEGIPPDMQPQGKVPEWSVLGVACSLARMPHLSHVRLAGLPVPQADASAALHALGNITALESMDLSGFCGAGRAMGATQAFIHAVATGFVSLRSLTLSVMRSDMVGVVFIASLRHLHALTQLSLTVVRADEEHMHALAQGLAGMPELCRLTLCASTVMHGAGAALATALPQLRHLKGLRLSTPLYEHLQVMQLACALGSVRSYDAADEASSAGDTSGSDAMHAVRLDEGNTAKHALAQLETLDLSLCSFPESDKGALEARLGALTRAVLALPRLKRVVTPRSTLVKPQEGALQWKEHLKELCPGLQVEAAADAWGAWEP